MGLTGQQPPPLGHPSPLPLALARPRIDGGVPSTFWFAEIRVFVTRVFLQKGNRMGWVKSAADQLEALLFLVATRSRLGTVGLTPQLPSPETSVAGS